MCQLYKLLGRSKPGITSPHSASLWVKRTKRPGRDKKHWSPNVEKLFDILGNAQNCKTQRKQREVQPGPDWLTHWLHLIRVFGIHRVDNSLYFAICSACLKMLEVLPPTKPYFSHQIIEPARLVYFDSRKHCDISHNSQQLSN